VNVIARITVILSVRPSRPCSSMGEGGPHEWLGKRGTSL